MPELTDEQIEQAAQALIDDLTAEWERIAPKDVEESSEKEELTAEDIDAIADILGGIFGDDALKFFNEGKDVAESLVDVFEWEEAKHPRGKGGRFIEAHSAEARASAHEEIEKVLHGKKTPESHKALVEHLSILNTKQLHEIRKKYGLKASGRLKQQLVEKLSDRLLHGNPEKKAKQPSNTLFKLIRSRGGIDVDALRKTHDVKTEFIESGLLGVLAGKDKDRRARGLDQWAKTLAEEWHVAFPPGSNPSEHLLSLLKQKALSLHDERTAEIAAEEKEYYRQMKEAQDAGIEQNDIGEAIRSGETAGLSEAEKGDAWEGPGELANAKSDEVEPWDEPENWSTVQQYRGNAPESYLVGKREKGWRPARDYKDYKEVHAIGAYLDTHDETAANRRRQWELGGSSVSAKKFYAKPGKTLDVETKEGRKELGEIQDKAFKSNGDYQEELTSELKRRGYRYVKNGGYLGEKGELVSLFPEEDLSTGKTNTNTVKDLIARLEKKGFHGTIDRLKKGIIDKDQAEGELEGTKKPNHSEPVDADPWKAASRMKLAGTGRQESWSRWIQLTSLNPGMDAKDWYAIYDSL